MKLLLFLILLVVCWPAALILLILSPLFWLVALPFRLLGMTIRSVFTLLRALLQLPLRLVMAR